MKSYVLVVDDDIFLAQGLESLLLDHDYEVATVGSAHGAWESIEQRVPDLMLLDLGLPDQDGVALCRRVRKKWVFPILMLTARSESIDKVLGLESGADDYLPKPFDAHELIARVRAILRRAHEYPSQHRPVVHRGGLQIDSEGRRVSRDGVVIDLTETEFKVLQILASNSGRAISRQHLFETVWRFEMDFNSNSLEVIVYRLRSKIADSQGVHPIKTLRGFGYIWEP